MGFKKTTIKLSNNFLRPIGLNLQKFSKFQHLFEQLLKNKKIKFVQVGANDGIRFDSLYFRVTEHRCAGIAIEPLPDLFARLRINYQDYPEVIPVNLAIHPTADKAIIYRVDPSRLGELPDWTAGIASFIRDHLLKTGVVKNEMIIEEEVACAPLMGVLKNYTMLDADYLQIDTEGFDLEIIKMIDFSKFKPSLIKYENQHLNEQDKKLAMSILSAAGYHLFNEGRDSIGYLK